jgi:hypothetical protein
MIRLESAEGVHVEARPAGRHENRAAVIAATTLPVTKRVPAIDVFSPLGPRSVVAGMTVVGWSPPAAERFDETDAGAHL